MSDPTEHYLRELAGLLPRRRRRRILAEIRYHLEQAAADAEREGLSAEAAEQRAIEQLGPAVGMAEQFRSSGSRSLRPHGPVGWASAAGAIVAAALIAMLAVVGLFSGQNVRTAAPTPPRRLASEFGPIHVAGYAQAVAALRARYPLLRTKLPPPFWEQALDGGFTEWLLVVPLPDGHLCPVLQVHDDHNAVVAQAAGPGQSWCLTSVTPRRPSLIENAAVPDDHAQRIILGRAPGALDVEVKLADGVPIVRPAFVKAFFLIVVNDPSPLATTVTGITSYLGLASPSKPGAASTWRTLTAT